MKTLVMLLLIAASVSSCNKTPSSPSENTLTLGDAQSGKVLSGAWFWVADSNVSTHATVTPTNAGYFQSITIGCDSSFELRKNSTVLQCEKFVPHASKQADGSFTLNMEQGALHIRKLSSAMLAFQDSPNSPVLHLYSR